MLKDSPLSNGLALTRKTLLLTNLAEMPTLFVTLLLERSSLRLMRVPRVKVENPHPINHLQKIVAPNQVAAKRMLSLF